MQLKSKHICDLNGRACIKQVGLALYPFKMDINAFIILGFLDGFYIYKLLFYASSVNQDQMLFAYDTDLNDLRNIIYLRKSEVSVENNSVCGIENWSSMACLPCSYIDDVIDLLP